MLGGFLAATTAVWETVVANDFHARALEVAKEIATIQPELVGLQEAYLWRVQDPGDFGGPTSATAVAYDYVADLLAALEALGQHYDAVVTLPLFDFEAPTLLGIDVRTTDRQVILARRGVETSNPRSGVYSVLLPLTVMGQPIHVQRGWTAVDAKVNGKAFTFFDTHLESFYAPVRMAQAAELATIVNATPGPIVLVGDLNSLPGTEGAAILTAPPLLGGAGLTDACGRRCTPSSPGSPAASPSCSPTRRRPSISGSTTSCCATSARSRAVSSATCSARGRSGCGRATTLGSPPRCGSSRRTGQACAARAHGPSLPVTTALSRARGTSASRSARRRPPPPRSPT